MGKAWAQADLTDLQRIALLAQETRDIVLATPGGHPNPDGSFDLTTEQADLLWAMAKQDQDLAQIHQAIAQNDSQPCAQNNQTPVVADEQREQDKKRNFRIFMTTRYFDQSQIEAAQGRYGMDRYSSWANNQFLTGGNAAFSSMLSVNGLVNRYKANNPGSNFDNFSLVEKQKRLQQFLKDQTGASIPSNLILKELTTSELINNPQNWKSTLNSVGGSLNFGEKMSVVSFLGGRFSDRYNYDRADGVGPQADGIVTIEQLLDSVKTGVPGGVCRDVASAQALMLKEMGVPNAYIVSYKTAGGRHANLIAQNPDNANEVVKVNYGYSYEANNQTGAGLLVQDTNMPDFGLEYKIYSADGKPITSMPSDLGSMLKISTGGANRSPIDMQQYTLNRVGVETPYGTGSLFAGTTSAGDTVVGFAVDKRWESANDIINVELGLAAFDLQGERTVANISQSGFYGRMRTELNTPYWRIGDNFSVRAESNLNMAASFSNNSVETAYGSRSEDNQVTEEIYGDIGIRGTYQDSSTLVEGSVATNFFPAWNDEVAADRIILAPSEVIGRVQLEQQFSDDMGFLADGGVILRGFQGVEGIGDSYFLRTGLQSRETNTSAVVGISGPIQSDQARFLDGSTTRINAGINQGIFNNRMNMSLSYERDIDLDQDLVQLGIGVNF